MFASRKAARRDKHEYVTLVMELSMTADATAQATGSVDQALSHAAAMLEPRPDLALEQAAAVLETVPGHPMAVLLSGAAQRRLGRIDEAHKLLAALAAAQPRSAATALEHGRVLAMQGDTPGALAAFRRAVALKDDYAEAWVELADTLRLEGDDAGADAAYMRSVRASTHDPVLAEAALAMVDGKLEVAEPLLKNRLRARPTDVAAIRMLGELALRVGREEDGIALLRRSVELAPGFDAARELLARILARGSNRILEALAETDALIERAPHNLSHLMFKASLLVRIGQQDEARDLYEKILKRNSKLPKTWMSLGHVLKTSGKQAEAVAAYRKALDQQPTLGEAWWSLANLKTVRFTDKDVEAMRGALTHTEDPEDLLHLEFSLGKAMEDAGKDEAAFHHYAEGNRIRRADLKYSADDTHDQCMRIAAQTTPAFLAARAGQGDPTPDPIFIVGLPRSGSTLVEQILASHSQVEGTMELPDLMSMVARMRSGNGKAPGGRYPEMLADLDADALRSLGDEYISRTRVHRQTSRPFYLDKMPNNWQHAGLIQLILPNAKIIDARRHPIGCCFSAWKQHFARGQGFSYDLTDIGRYYRDYVFLMDAFDKAAPGRIHRVIYERMVADTENEVRRLLDYVGLPFEEGCLAFWKNDRAVRTASSEQVRQPIFKDAVDHWKRFEPWLGPLVAALGPVVEAYPDAPKAAS
jgi:tetratricopeptide (TPR) repeat protein